MDTRHPHLNELAFPAPALKLLATGYDSVGGLLDQGDRTAALAEWDALRRDYGSWATLARLRFQQDTTDAAAKAAREQADGFDAVVAGHDAALKRRLLADPDRDGLVATAGAHAVSLWEADVGTFDPAIAERLVEEARLAARYTALTASARFEVEGQVVNLSGLAPFAESLDRDVRHRAARAQWGFFAEHGAEFDAIFDGLVRLRDGMARDLGDESFTALGYRRMRRLGYGPADVEGYRDEIVAHVVPLVARLMEERRQANGWDRLRAWDLPLVDPLGNPKPVGGRDVLVAATQEAFDRMDPRLGDLHRAMEVGGFLDLQTRPDKAPGGFCEAFATTGMPVIFANFAGTQDDIRVLVHEMGHAAQMHASRTQPCFDYLSPTSEAAEVNAMALEMLVLPHAGLLVEAGAAERFRRVQLVSLLGLMCLCALGDHFQHEVYARPEASPAERHAMWHRLERRYAPWLDWGDLSPVRPRAAPGRRCCTSSSCPSTSSTTPWRSAAPCSSGCEPGTIRAAPWTTTWPCAHGVAPHRSAS
jgi:M3 family oligoendopeptidase